ncbi:hypothetical protein F751_2936 [Auxenochlorella protothecoides]|uniref:Uncharacterized protein n=2 Tax=Auxenochlorella protothecoides TaxID=3075 RepID=A0A087SAJ1_AUXPR|nr:hypothetical protein F751_2936 [Auxenochlorella protothecoides]KFM22745.1 hypothetical protein F751_2936 [Auxenochlorella protothecoides]RMZ52232.1 hypothetical protein APUTEX25_001622 [Auxenochlorella protothecoides]|eukprot:RMZ52232.1 hypothetical protein APUTEX25_001622 [Auxenochlorella protothecoides]
MTNRVWLNVAYLAPRWAVWTLLLVVASIDACRHRHVRSRGWQLYAVLLGATGLFVVRDTFLFAYAVSGVGPDWARSAWFGAYIFFSNLAEAYFIWILIIIAAGYCITRSDLGPHRAVAISIPAIVFVTSLVVDYVLYSMRGFEAFSDQSVTVVCVEGVEDPENPCTPGEELGAATGLVFFICIMANMMAFLLAWFFVFETVQKERERLEGGDPYQQEEESPAAAPGLPVSRAGGGLTNGHAAGVGHAAVPTQVLLEEGRNASHLYGATEGRDADEPRTVQDRIETRDKLRLIRTFFYGVSTYVVANLFVIFLPIFVPTVVDRVILALMNGLLLIFVSVLLWTFRMRAGNAYLVLGEAVGMETTTELGVLSAPPKRAGPSQPVGGGVYDTAFTLDEEEEEEEARLARGPSSSAPRQAGLNRSAARKGVVVTDLPSTPH